MDGLYKWGLSNWNKIKITTYISSDKEQITNGLNINLAIKVCDVKGRHQDKSFSEEITFTCKEVEAIRFRKIDSPNQNTANISMQK